MDDFYKTLGCNKDATHFEIKQLVQRARLRFHPDKNLDKSSDEFINIEKAWFILQCPERRRIYDNMLTQNEIMFGLSGFPIQGEVCISNFNKEEIDSDDCTTVYWTPCRCGGSFVIDQMAVLCFCKYAKCTDCSLTVSVVYPPKLNIN